MKFFRQLLTWKQKHPTEFWFLIIILLIATFLRLWRIDEYLPFLGDEGRDVRVVSRFLKNFDLMFIGPRTSIGDMYLGPLYYYLIAPFLLLWNFSPTGPAVFVALLSVATVFLLWLTGRDWFGNIAGITASLLYAISPLVITSSVHSWNPNIMPFFSLLTIYGLWRVWKESNWKWLLVSGFSFAAMVQSHYLGLLLIPVVGIIWIAKLYLVRKSKSLRPFIRYSLYSIILFLLLMSPLVLFDTKHGWHNFLAMKKFFSERQETVSAKPWNALPSIFPFWRDELVSKLVLVKNSQFAVWVAGFLVIVYGYLGFLWKKRSKEKKLFAHFFLGAWVFFGLLGLGLIKQNIYDHYYGFLFPAPFLIIGAIAQETWRGKLRWLVIVIVTVLVGINLINNPLKYPPQKQMQTVQEIDRKIIEEAKGQPFNFALIAERNYEEGYLYFLEQWKAPVREINPLDIENTLTKQLFVVCEDPICEPINHRKAEIANFGWVKIDQEWQVSGRKLFKLVHTK